MVVFEGHWFGDGGFGVDCEGGFEFEGGEDDGVDGWCHEMERGVISRINILILDKVKPINSTNNPNHTSTHNHPYTPSPHQTTAYYSP